MSPSSNNAGMELPPPVEVPSAEVSPNSTINKEEVASAAPEKAPDPAGPSQSSAPPPLIPLPIPTTPLITQGQTDDAQSTDAQSGTDKDLIEKEWVNKAKAIVEKTKDDPYKQADELSLLKADYLKKQFNKTLKLNS